MRILLLLILVAAVLVAGCASDSSFRQGERLLAEGRTDEGLAALEQAVREAPRNARYRAALLYGREVRLKRMLAAGDAAFRAGRLDAAEAAYRDLLRQFPDDTRADEGLAAIDTARRDLGLMAEAEAAYGKGDYEIARVKLRSVLAKEPGHAEAAQMIAVIDEKTDKARVVEAPQLAAGLRRPVSLEFRDAPLKVVFDAVSRQGGINFVFDKDIKLDQKATIFARETALADVLDMLLATSQLARKVLNANTLLVYPDQPAKQKVYEDEVVRSFFLAHADAKQAMTMIKAMAKVRDVYVDEKLNMVMVRDTPEAVRLVEKLVRVADRPEPEVMLEVEILEVKHSKLMELGVQWPNQFSLLAKREVTSETVDTSGSVVAKNTEFIDVPMTVDLLKHIRGSNVGISPTPVVTMRKDDGDVNILANPRIRVRNKEKAKIHIGDKVPVITANVTSTGVTSESVSYLDVGLKLDVEPQVSLDGKVAIKVDLGVSNIVQQVKNATGTLTYQLGSRNATTSLSLADGETQVLAGLISDEERASAAKVPGLGDIPLLGRLFSTHSDSGSKTEIVLLITPRILRNIERPELAESEFYAGTERSSSDQPLRLRTSRAQPGPAADGAPEGEPGTEQAADVEGRPEAGR